MFVLKRHPLTTESSRASAVVSCHQIHADLECRTSHSCALINVVLAPKSIKSILALAKEVVAMIPLRLGPDAAAIVLTGLLGARIVNGVAIGTHELGSALASESIDGICASPSISAGVALTFVDVHGAGLAGISRSTCASEPIDEILARSPVGARIRQALVNVRVAVLSGPAGLTVAAVSAAL